MSSVFDGRKLKERRKKLGITLDILAPKVGCVKSYLSELENGIKSNPGIDIVFLLAKALKVKMEWFCKDSNVQDGSNVP
jgi:XRE family transcriptional regulator, master regulator for biofilm formation